MHSLLVEQLEKHVGSIEALPQDWQRFIQAVDETYQQADTLPQTDLQQSEAMVAAIQKQGRALLDVIQNVALGEFDVQVEIPEGIDILTDIGLGLQMMVDDIRDMIAEQVQARQQLERAHSDLDDALQRALTIQRRYTHEGWSIYAAGMQQGALGYRMVGENVQPVATQEDVMSESENDVLSTPMFEAIEQVQMVTSAEPSAHSLLALPLEFYGEPIGVLGFSRGDDEGWSDSELDVVRTIVAQAAQALENQRLFDEQQRSSMLMQKRVREVACLNDIGLKLAQEPSIAELLAWTAERIPDAIEYPQICLVAIDFQEHVYGDSQSFALPTQIVQGLRIGGELLGRICIAYTEDYPFSDEESSLLGDIARRVSTYIEGRRLFDETQRRAQESVVLLELGRSLAAQLDLDQVLHQVYQGVSRLIDTTNFYIGLYDRNSNQVSFPFNVTESVVDQEIVVISADQGLTGHILRSGQSLLIGENVGQWMQDHGIETVGQVSSSFLAVPLMLGDQVLGVMAVQDYHRSYLYTEADRALLVSIASQASIAIQNARLFEAAQERAQREQILREMTTRLRGSTDPDVIVRSAVRELGMALGRQVFVRLGTDAELTAPRPNKDPSSPAAIPGGGK